MKPNILFILIDDLGWRDLGCYGSPFYETPRLDRLYYEGMHFTDAYAACPVCSPTRASILSGKYPARLGLTDWIDFNGTSHPCCGRLVDAPYVDHLSTEETSLAKALRNGGYQTWHVGKWHCGGAPYLPEHHGFDVNVGGCEHGSPGSGGYFAPWSIPALRNVDVPKGTYLDDYLTNRAIELIENRDKNRPFFLNLWYYLVHTPIQANKELVEKYAAKARQMKLDSIKALVEGEAFPTEAKKRITRRVMQSHPVYAAMIEILDANIGRLLDALDQAGVVEETMILFTSDNGGLATAEGSPTCNAPLSEGKGWMYEGGTREPLIVRLPGRIPPGSVCKVPVTSPDFYPTLLEAAGLPLRPEQHIDGISLLPLLQGHASQEDRPIFWHYPHYGNQGGTPGCAVRCGDWKLIEFFEDGRRELYHLREDVSETRNLAKQAPDRVACMAELLGNWRKQVQARIPQPNPDYND